MFEVIPVLDLRGGVVVHARRGDRGRYQPLRSTLCDGSGPMEVVRGLLGLHGFGTVYVADLDAIEGTGDNLAAVAGLAAAFPGLRFWVDAGFRDAAAVRRFLEHSPGDPVLGSESLVGTGALEALRDGGAWPRVVLSLDFRDGFLGPPDLPVRGDLWPERVIAMTLARVGSGDGPDTGRLAELGRVRPRTRLFAAGGVRDGGDLLDLAARGVAGALVATALHDGHIGAGDLPVRGG